MNSQIGDTEYSQAYEVYSQDHQRQRDALMDLLQQADPSSARRKRSWVTSLDAKRFCLADQAEEAANQPNTVNITERILAMKLTTKITIAAAVLIAFCGLLTWLTPGGGTALAFDNLAEAFANIRTATCKMTTEVEGPNGKTTQDAKVMFLAPSRERVESDTGGTTMIHIADVEQGKMLDLRPKNKMAFLYGPEDRDGPSEQQAANRGNSFEQLRKRISEAQSGEADNVEPLGQQTMDGRRVVGFRIRGANFVGEIWADPETALPVRVEYTTSVEPKARVVMSDFQIDVELDKSLFSLKAPEGYAVHEKKIDVSTPTAEDLAQALRAVAEHNDGLFPAELRGAHDIESFVGRVFIDLQAKHGKDSPETLKAMADFGGKLARGTTFLRMQWPKNDWHYAGKDVKLDTPDTPIFWYKPAESDEYRVIYADLSVKDVSAGNVPKEPQSSGETSSDASTQ